MASWNVGWLMAAVFPFLFVGMWFGVIRLIGAVGGWFALAERYAAHNECRGETLNFRSASFGLMNYGNCVTFGFADDGLYISLLFPFRFGHPTLRIPWEDLSSKETRRLFFKRTEFRFAKVPNVGMQVTTSLGEEILRQRDRR